MDLVVVRHALAYERDLSRWPGDRDRPLTREGEARFRKAAKGLGRIVPRVDVLLSSPLVRAGQTAEILSDKAGWPAPEPFEAGEPDRTAKDVVEALEPHLAYDVVALVGHEPLLGELIAYLLTGSDESEAFALKKGGAARLAFDGDPGRGAILRWLLTPKLERALRS